VANKGIRETIREIERVGGTNVEVEHKRKHDEISFDLGGVRRCITRSSGTKGMPTAEIRRYLKNTGVNHPRSLSRAKTV
jgi:hypothetical protein